MCRGVCCSVLCWVKQCAVLDRLTCKFCVTTARHYHNRSTGCTSGATCTRNLLRGQERWGYVVKDVQRGRWEDRGQEEQVQEAQAQEAQAQERQALQPLQPLQALPFSRASRLSGCPGGRHNLPGGAHALSRFQFLFTKQLPAGSVNAKLATPCRLPPSRAAVQFLFTKSASLAKSSSPCRAACHPPGGAADHLPPTLQGTHAGPVPMLCPTSAQPCRMSACGCRV